MDLILFSSYFLCYTCFPTPTLAAPLPPTILPPRTFVAAGLALMMCHVYISPALTVPSHPALSHHSLLLTDPSHPYLFILSVLPFPLILSHHSLPLTITSHPSLFTRLSVLPFPLTYLSHTTLSL